MDTSTDKGSVTETSAPSRQHRASNASRASTTSNSTTSRASRRSDHSPGAKRGSRPATTSSVNTGRASPRSARSASPPTARRQDTTPGTWSVDHGRQQAAHSRQCMEADESINPTHGVRTVLDAQEGLMLRYTLAVARLLLMGVGAYIIAWTGHLVRGLIAEYNSVPPTATMLLIIMSGGVLDEFLQAAWLVFALRPTWRPSNGCGLGLSLKPYTWELSSDLLFAGIWGAMVGSIFLRRRYRGFEYQNRPYVAAGSCAIGLQLICVALVIRLRVVLTLVAANQVPSQSHVSVVVRRQGPQSTAAKYGFKGAANAANMV